MGLSIQFSTVHTIDAPPSWNVFGAHLIPECRVFVWGFARRADAEIARRVMLATGINWDAQEPELRQMWIDFGGREAMMRRVCEHLQW